VCLFSSPDIFKCSFSLKEKVLTWDVDLQGGGHVSVLVLFTGDL